MTAAQPEVTAPRLAQVDAVDRVDIAALVRAQTEPLLRYFLRRVDDREDAADLLGETLLVVWRRANGIPRDEQEARMWMYGVAANVLKNAQRGARRRMALADRLRESLTTTRMPESAVEADARIDVERALARLDPRDRELIRLVHWDGLTVAEASTVLGVNASTARTRYARARAKLAGILSVDGEPAATNSPSGNLRAGD